MLGKVDRDEFDPNKFELKYGNEFTNPGKELPCPIPESGCAIYPREPDRYFATDGPTVNVYGIKDFPLWITVGLDYIEQVK